MAIKKAFQTIPSKVIIGTLNWGLGHATRCMPIIQYLLDHKCKVILASDGNALNFLKAEYPQLKAYVLPSYDISYKQKKIEHSMLLQSPKIFKAILKEKEALAEIVKQEKPDLIISDNRLGFRINTVKSVYITHQLKLLSDSNLFSQLGSKIHQSYIEKFDECWIPDLEGSILSGDMSMAQIKTTKRFLGCLSRMQKEQTNLDKIYHSIAILSGPEPQRTILEEKLIKILSQIEKPALLIRGLMQESNKMEKHGSVLVNNYLLSTDLQVAIAQSNKIICRSGYSSIMDLHTMGREAILIPTPGQTEQIYLAKRAAKSGRHIWLEQKNLEKELADFLRE